MKLFFENSVFPASVATSVIQLAVLLHLFKTLVSASGTDLTGNHDQTFCFAHT